MALSSMLLSRYAPRNPGELWAKHAKSTANDEPGSLTRGPSKIGIEPRRGVKLRETNAAFEAARRIREEIDSDPELGSDDWKKSRFATSAQTACPMPPRPGR